jgi:phosphatidylserine/phosphatidylglycerophosphate/cardiolipin synthase-like enzyme
MEKILNALADAGGRGVKVRIITDEAFRKETASSFAYLSGKPNIQWKWIKVFKELKGINHSKYFIIDGDELFLGSQNFDWRSLTHISEMGVHVRHHEGVKIACDLFELDWKLCGAVTMDEAQSLVEARKYRVPFTVTDKNGESVEFCPVYSPPGLIPDKDLQDIPEIISLIDSAKKEVDLQVLTYCPVSKDGEFWPDLDLALRRAADRGVTVKLLFSDWATREPSIDLLKSLSTHPNLTKGEPSNIHIRISTIPQWSKGFIPYARVQHSKFLIIDDRACWVGSSNWEKNYFYCCRNLGMIMRGPKISGELKNVFLKSWKSLYARPLDIRKKYIPPSVSGEKKPGEKD